MYALAVHDDATGSLTLARDPLGIKPLFVMRRSAGVVFASELKAIVAAVGSELRIDPAGLVASALYYWLPEEMDAVQGVRKLPAGTWTELRPDGSTVTGRFWDAVEEAAAAAAGPPRDVREVIEESVAAHLVADVPVAAFLSGGLDSSIVTALAHRADPGSRPSRSPSVARTSVSRRCRTTPATPGRWPLTWGSGSTRSRSPGRGRHVAQDGRHRLMSRSETRRRSTRC